MRLWNLSSLEKLSTKVVTSQRPFIPPKRSRGPGIHTSSPMNIAMTVAALAAVSYSVVTVSGSSTVLTVPRVAAVEVACNVDVEKPPLEALFAGRFNDSWTRAKEDEVLREAARKPPVPERDFLNLAHTAQHEAVSDDAPRLSDGEILKITRRKV
jgi:hypothetical protein